MKGCLATDDISAEEVTKRAVEGAGVVGMDYVREVTPKAPYDWDPKDTLSRRWTIVKGAAGETSSGGEGETFETLPPVRHRIVAYDFGMKHNILRRLRQQGFKVRVVPADTSAAEVLAMKPEGVFLSNGPGDPAALDYVHENIRHLMGQTPIFGIALDTRCSATLSAERPSN
jgi:carbamoyl-phosphate synthase small subunit